MRGRLAIALTVLVIGVAACGDTADGDDGGAAASSDVESEAAAGGDEPILIVLRYDFPDGEVLPESRIGDSPFCPGGTTHDEHGGGAGEGWVVSTFDCPNGELTITFSPTQHSLKQSSAWRVVEQRQLQGFRRRRVPRPQREVLDLRDEHLGGAGIRANTRADF
jgi:hypothetical protein